MVPIAAAARTIAEIIGQPVPYNLIWELVTSGAVRGERRGVHLFTDPAAAAPVVAAEIHRRAALGRRRPEAAAA